MSCFSGRKRVLGAIILDVHFFNRLSLDVNPVPLDKLNCLVELDLRVFLWGWRDEEIHFDSPIDRFQVFDVLVQPVLNLHVLCMLDVHFLSDLRCLLACLYSEGTNLGLEIDFDQCNPSYSLLLSSSLVGLQHIESTFGLAHRHEFDFFLLSCHCTLTCMAKL